MAPDAYFEASAETAKGQEGSESCKTGFERKRDFNVENAVFWDSVHCQGMFFLVRSMSGHATVE